MSGFDPRPCPVCRRAGATILVVPDALVYCNVLWPTPEEARGAPRGTIELAYCEACGMLWNAAFDPELVAYTPAYENSLHFSPTFRDYAASLADRLVERYALRGADVLELGCGKGEFLSLLCAGGRNRGIGFDPSYDGEADAAADGHVRFVRDAYTAAHVAEPVDFVCCRHVLEHVDDPRAFLATVREALGERPVRGVYFEVPSAEYMLREAAIWDLIFEHRSYFTAPALRRLFEETGFEVLEVGFSFGDQYLFVEARPAPSRSAGSGDGYDARPLRALADGFARSHGELEARWERQLSSLLARGPVALWGAGSKGVTFLSLVSGADDVCCVVDVNPRKHGRYVGGRGHLVVAPERLVEAAPRSVVVTNPLYVSEITRQTRQLGLAADVVPT